MLNMMKRLFLTFAIVITGTCYGQSDSSCVNRFAIKISPLSFHVPYVGRSARLSFEYRIKPYISLEHEFGLFFDNSSGYMIRTDIKKYLKSDNDGTYIALDLFYKYQAYSTSDTILNAFQNYSVNKNVETLSFKYGRVITFKFGMLVDLYCGLGIRFQQNRNSLSENENNQMPSTTDYNINWILNKAGNRVYPNILVGLKVGYRFK